MEKGRIVHHLKLEEYVLRKDLRLVTRSSSVLVYYDGLAFEMRENKMSVWYAFIETT